VSTINVAHTRDDDGSSCGRRRAAQCRTNEIHASDRPKRAVRQNAKAATHGHIDAHEKRGLGLIHLISHEGLRSTYAGSKAAERNERQERTDAKGRLTGAVGENRHL